MRAPLVCILSCVIRHKYETLSAWDGRIPRGFDVCERGFQRPIFLRHERHRLVIVREEGFIARAEVVQPLPSGVSMKRFLG